MFTLVAASITHFLTAAIKCFSSKEICLHCSYFSVFHVSENIIISDRRREDSALPPKRAGGWNAMFHSSLHEGWMYVRTILSEPKFLGYIDNQIFLLVVLRCARDSSAKIMRSKDAQWRPKE